MKSLRGLVAGARWRLGGRARRLGVAWRYLTGRMTNNDGWALFHEAQDVTRFYCLEGFDPSAVIDMLTEEYGERPELAEVAERACARVAHKWSSSGDTAGAAEDWARDLAREYLRDRGISPPPDEIDAWKWEMSTRGGNTSPV